MMRLAGAGEAGFLAWFEDHNEAVVVLKALQPGDHSDREVTISQLLEKLG
jgi:hypothetical protein